MKHRYLLFIIALASCNGQQEPTTTDTTNVSRIDSANPVFDDHIHGTDTVDLYANKRFKNVRVEKTGDTSYHVTGSAQVFEAAFNWVVEDGHEELMSGHGMTDAGAPEFGKFDLRFSIKKKRPGSTLQLVLFESSPKDGSRQHELPVPLD